MQTVSKFLIASMFALLGIIGGKAEDYEQLGEPALPPVGYWLFCMEQPSECSRKDGGVQAVSLNAKNRAVLEHVNALVNSLVTYQLDKVIWGKKEKWAYPSKVGHVVFGDCEDYVLLKRKMLIERGFPVKALLITLVRTKDGSSHAVLTVVTTTGDYVLDSLNNKIVRWEKTGYALVKRQSKENPNRWVKGKAG